MSGINVIVLWVEFWLDVCVIFDIVVCEFVDVIVFVVFEVVSDEGCEFDVVEESFSGVV